MKPLQILITRFPYKTQLGGEEFHTVNLAKALIKKGHYVELLTSDKILYNLFKKADIKCVYALKIRPPVTLASLIIFTLLSPFNWLFLNFLLLKFYYRRKSKGKLIMYNLGLSEKLLMTLSAKLIGIKTIWIEHARIGKWLTHNPWLPIYFLGSLFTDIISPSKQTAIPIKWAKNIHIIPHGVLFKEDIERKDAKIKKNLKSFNILCVARLSEDKGIGYIIKAMKILTNQQSNIESIKGVSRNFNKVSKSKIILKIVGEGLMKAEFQALISQNNLTNQIKLIGKVQRKNLNTIYNEADLFILPSSEHDPFGLVIVESMQMKLPVICTNVCGVSEFLQNKKDAIIIPAKDENALYKAIQWSLTNQTKLSRIAQNGYNTAINKFNHDRMVNDYIKLFKS